MKKAKLALAALAVMATVGTVNAQTTFGVRAGVGLNGLTGKGTDNLDNKFGWHAGVNLEKRIGNDIYFQPNLLFYAKGSEATIANVKTSTTLNYLEVPLNFVYKGEVGSGKVLVGLGPYVGYGIGTKSKVGSNSTSPSFEDVNLKKFDLGGNLLLGWEFSNNLSAQLNAGMGFMKINDKQVADYSPKNIGFGVSLGYRF